MKAEVLFHTISAAIRQIFTNIVSMWKDCREQSVWDATNIHRKCGKIRWNW